MVLARIFCSLFSLFAGVFTFLCSASYWILRITDGVKRIRITLFGHSFHILKLEPGIVIPYAANEGLEGFDGISDQILVCLAVSAALWLFLQIVSSRILRLFANKKTTLHGSSRWATRKELRRSGLLSGFGVVLGQTHDAVYEKQKPKKPKRRSGESRADYANRLMRYNPDERVFHLKKPGDIISQAKNNHTLIVGSTRSGKGVGVIIPTEFQWSESMIVFDPKGEGWDISANFRSRFSYTFKFEPEKPNESIHYNPLLAIRRGKQTIPDIQNLGFILIPNNEQDKDPFWANEGRKLFCAVAGYVIYCEPPERKTFAQIYSVFSNSAALDDADDDDENKDGQESLSMIKQYLFHYANKAELYIENGGMPADFQKRWDERDKLSDKERKKLEEEAKKYLDDDDKASLQRIWQDLIYFANCEDKQLSSVVSTMTSQLQVIADPNVQSVTDRSDFTMEDFVYGIKGEDGTRRPLSLYLIVSMSSLQRLVPLIKIFFEQAITLLCRDLDGKRPYRLLMMIDEFRQLGKMDVVEKALALSAGYGIILAVAIQSYDQLRVLYQSEAMFVDNFAFQVILRVNDEGTSQKIEKILGQTTKQHRETSFSGNNALMSSTSNTRSVREMGRSLLTSEEIRTMPDDEAIIIQSGQHPYKAKKIMYYLDKRFRRFYVGRDGKNLPPPKIAENYPHPETFIYPDRESQKKKDISKAIFPGIDTEGWHELMGADVAIAGFNDSEMVDSAKERRGVRDIVDSTTVDDAPEIIDDTIADGPVLTESTAPRRVIPDDVFDEAVAIADGTLSDILDEIDPDTPVEDIIAALRLKAEAASKEGA